MRTKEEYYEHILENRKIISNSAITDCPCPVSLCEWHGKCKECVALHRHHNDHIPTCLQPLINDKLKELVKVGEMVATKKEKTPIEYSHYVRERDKQKN